MLNLQEVIREPYKCADCNKQTPAPSLYRPTKQLLCFDCWRVRTQFEALGKKVGA
jgi:recombinational DNA repair protein (RecF pathway)